ncbi:NERD domain-containing protein [Paenibacillus polysaccharolyticus]|uniref:nuclease-related domain-containing protein n=1 Tax=Paenibacillus polysaccharolyticus TaxID=582692 RepID=UPI002041B71A|nr:nuclease-related domain-containing protein [Paenibacillus polysaccharolyticus]MCM3134099.1 NERD domain-containing protein [Paenibacillus polysaccharolyticus]
MFKKIWSLFKAQPELVSPLTDSVAASALQPVTAIPPRLARGRRKKKKSEPDWISTPQEPTTAELLLGLPSEYKVLNDLLVTNPKSRSGYSQIDHVVIGPRAIFVIETRNLTTGEIRGGRREANWSVSSSRVKMYNPLMQHRAHVEAIQAHLGDYKRVRLVSMVTFTNRCRISVDPAVRYVNSDEMIIYDHELVETIQRKTERLETELPETLYQEQDTQAIWNMLNAVNSTDHQIRAEHMAKAKGIK